MDASYEQDMWSLKTLFENRCFSSSYKDHLSDSRSVESATPIDGKERIYSVVKAFVLICYCLALNCFMAYVMRFGVNHSSYGVAAFLLVSLVYFLYLYKCEKVEVDSGKLQTVRSFFYAFSVIYIMVMLMCVSSLLLINEKSPNV